MRKPLWTPEKTRAAQTILGAFSVWMSSRAGKPFADYDELHRYSTQSPAEFWSGLWDFAGVVGDKGAPPYLVDADKMPGAQFFPRARLNFAENLLKHKDGAGDALVFWGEDKVKRRMSWRELAEEVACTAQALREAGVTVGDRVAAILPNMPESIVSVLATASIGAVWSSCSPDFGVQGVLDRLSQIEPKVLIACDGYYYNGKALDISDKLSQIVAKLPTAEEGYRQMLGLPLGRRLSGAEIHRAYKRAAKTAHPDGGGNARAFLELSAVHDALMKAR